jgi:hypothetical protein
MQLIGALLGRDWPAHGTVEFIGKVRHTGKATGFNATLTSGKEKVDMVLSGAFDRSPPHIKGKITATNFYLPDLAERQSRKRAERRKAEKTSSAHKPVFSRTPIDTDGFKAVDLDLSIDIVSFDRAYSAAESAQVAITLKSGHLSVQPATLVYPKGKASLDLQVDTRDALKMSFTLAGENLDPWRGLNIYEGASDGVYKAEDAHLDAGWTSRL